MTILDKILSNKKYELTARQKVNPLAKILNEAGTERKALSLVSSLTADDSSGIIAEFKTMSPSKGLINNSADVEVVTRNYAEAGAAGLSVLTDSNFFGGTFEDLKRARKINRLPILQKDFIIDEYQIAEAYLYGADVILLIAAALDKERVRSLSAAARKYGLEVILEIHNKDELTMLTDDVNIVGVNNRDLKTFNTSYKVSVSLAEHIPPEFVKISESGIYDAETILRLREAGFNGFLVGESFMSKDDPGEACRQLIEQLKRK